MIKNLVQNVWKTEKRVAAMADVEGLILLGGFKGEIGVLSKKTGKNSWAILDDLKEEQITNLQLLKITPQLTFLVQTKSGTFSVIELTTPSDTSSSFTFTSNITIRSDNVTLNQYPIYQSSASSWCVSTSMLSDSMLTTIDCRLDDDTWILKICDVCVDMQPQMNENVGNIDFRKNLNMF